MMRRDRTCDNVLEVMLIGLAGLALLGGLVGPMCRALVDPNECIPYRPPQPGHEETSVIRLTERMTGMPYVWVMAHNWLREEDPSQFTISDPEAITVRIRRIYPMLDCRVVLWVNLAGDLNNDGRVDLNDLNLYSQWWLADWVPPYTPAETG
jgi:hypothetical protein